jgi:hypothetical protein
MLTLISLTAAPLALMGRQVKLGIPAPAIH